MKKTKDTKIKSNKEKLNVGAHNLAQDRKGITLIALIITIIVMLTIVAVTISMAVNGGLFEKAGQAVGETENAVNKEQELSNGKIEIGGVWYDSIDDYLEHSDLPSAPGTKPYLPGSNFSQVTGTDLSTGLVIKDNVGNEYVWIEVPNNGTGPDYSSVSSSTDYDNIETALRKYASKYISPAHYDEWYDGNGATATGSTLSSGSPRDVEPTGTPSYAGSKDTASGLLTSITIGEIAMSTNLEDTSGCGLTYVQYTSLKHQMLTSIYENGGFWIGKYEAGITEPRTEHSAVTTSTTIKALSQQNQYPLNYVYCSEAQILASKVATDAGLENHTTSLMFGIQWDLLLTYLEKKGTTYAELAGGDEVGSTNWGNYSNNLWTISNTSAKYATGYGKKSWLDGAYGAKTSSGSILLSTGADLSFSKMNIYDLAGNVWEWTLEHSTKQGFQLGNARGGCMENKGNHATSCTRMYVGWIMDCAQFIGFRVTIY